MGIYDGLLRVYRNLRLVHMNLRLEHMNLRLVHMNLRLVHMNALCFSSNGLTRFQSGNRAARCIIPHRLRLPMQAWFKFIAAVHFNALLLQRTSWGTLPLVT